MADTRLTRIGFCRALLLCIWAVSTPRKLVDAEAADEEARKSFPPAPPGEPDAFKVRRAFWNSLGLVLCSIAVGYVAGCLMAHAFRAPAPSFILVLQTGGAMLLLWGTLFVRGWDIQTIGGVTLSERVNHWIYRSLYFLGTAAIVASLAMTPG